MCYACAAQLTRTAMVHDGKATLYLVHSGAADECTHPVAQCSATCANPRHWSVTDWPGVLSFPVGLVRHSYGYGFGGRYSVTHAWFTGPDGRTWLARNAGDSQIACCKRLKRG